MNALQTLPLSEELDAQLAPVRLSFSSTTVPVVYLDPTWRIVACNPVAAGNFTVWRSFFDYVEPEPHDRGWLRRHLEKAAPGEFIENLDALVPLDGGARRYYSWSILVNRGVRGCEDRHVAVGWPCPLERRVALLTKLVHLTPREREIVQLLVEAYTNTNIAARLAISQSTVKNHLKTIFAKTVVSSRLELVHRLAA